MDHPNGRSDPLLSFQWSGHERPSEALITAVAEVADEEPMTLDPLYESIDPEALDRLFRPASDSKAPEHGVVTFAYAGYRVAITAERTGYVYPQAEIATTHNGSFH